MNGDYIRTSEIITFSGGTQRHNVTVPIVNDGIFEILEDFSATLTTSDERIILVEPLATVEIVDNDNGKM